MRRALLLSLAVVSMIACGYGYEARTTTITGAPMITSGPGAGERELPRTLNATSQRVAQEVCKHEQRCGRSDDVSACVDATVGRARDELMRWNCAPAAIRARFEECLAGVNDEPCLVDLRTEDRKLCPRPNVDCMDYAAQVTPPGPELAKIWE
jgi:hypothetical protein